MPIFTNLLTVQRALNKKIRDSLDIFHVGVNETVAQIIKLENFGISPLEIALGITLVVVGVMTYYLAPAAFLFRKMEIFFFILNFILIGMILGLGFICVLIFPYIQQLIIHLICLCVKIDRKLKPLIMKNINETHSKRNTKTSILFTVCLAYLIFGGSSLLLIGNLIISFLKNTVGADVYVSSMVKEKNLPEAEIRHYLDEEIAKENPLVLDYSFGSRSIRTFLANVTGNGFGMELSNGGGFPHNGIHLLPVEENYLNSSFIEYYMPQHLQRDIEFRKTRGKDDVIWSLFSDEGTTEFIGGLDKYNISTHNFISPVDPADNELERTAQIKMVLPEGIQRVLSINGGDTIKLRVTGRGNRHFYRALIRGMPRKVPGYNFMSYRQIKDSLTGLISFDQAIELAKIYIIRSDNAHVYDGIQKYSNCKSK